VGRALEFRSFSSVVRHIGQTRSKVVVVAAAGGEVAAKGDPETAAAAAELPLDGADCCAAVIRDVSALL
jgi:hypothetical protein